MRRWGQAGDLDHMPFTRSTTLTEQLPVARLDDDRQPVPLR